MNQPELTLVLIGFGNVARRFVRLLDETADRLDFTWKVVGIATRHHGSVVDPDGIDTRRAITTVDARHRLVLPHRNLEVPHHRAVVREGVTPRWLLARRDERQPA